MDSNSDGVSLLTAHALGLDPSLNLAGSMPKAVRWQWRPRLSPASCGWW